MCLRFEMKSLVLACLSHVKKKKQGILILLLQSHCYAFILKLADLKYGDAGGKMRALRNIWIEK